jgi:hypothetical protein
MKKTLHCLVACLLFVSLLPAQSVDLSYYLPKEVQYNAAVPTPQAFLGWQVGEWHVSHDLLVSYMRELDRVSDRIEIEPYARSYEGRPLLLLTVTSQRNRASLPKLKEDHRRLTDPAQSGSLDVGRMPAVVWVGCSVHGNEPSGANASLLLAYYLAAAQGPAIDSLLDETVILLDPAFNPDGLNRFASWVNTHKSKTPVSDPASRELNENWPPGRTNHYWFDLNRDWLYVQHPESQGRIAKFHEWKPNVLTDHHEQGSNATFFFQPGVPSRVHPLTPKKNQELTARMGTYHAKALDKIGSLYFTEENYDDFYYGKGSTYPDVQGSVGILFEQASSRGHAQETTNGVLRFPFTIRNQFVTMLSTLAAVRDLRPDLLGYQRDFYRDAAREGKGAATRAFVFGSKEDPARTYEMLRILRQQQVDVYKAGGNVNAGGRTYEPAWAYVVPANQPQHRLINAMFERRTTFQDSLFYDISAFSLPLAFNMPYAELKSVPGLGEKVETPVFPAGSVTGDTATAYAYLFPWDGYYAPRAVQELLSRGYKVRVATKPFTAAIGGQTVNFDYGTILVPAGIQDANQAQLPKLVTDLARRDGLGVYALGTGATGTGIDLGSSNFAPLDLPKVMLLVGPGVNPNDAGEVWHLLDQRYGMPPVLVDVNQAGRTDFWKYNVIVMGSGNYGALGNSTVDNLKRWIEDGGTLITMTDAVGWAIARGLANVKTKKNPVDSTAARPYASLEENTRAQDIVGAIFQLRLDRTHPLAYGYKDELIPTFRDNTLFLEKPRNPYAAPAVFTANPLLSGYITKSNLKQLSNSASVVVNALGAGKVILMTDNPNFRAFWYGTNRLFMNAIFFGKTINPAAGRVEE